MYICIYAYTCIYVCLLAEILVNADASMVQEARGDSSLSDAMIRIHEIDKRQVLMFSSYEQCR